MENKRTKYTKSQKLSNKAYDLIEKYDFNGALKIGKELSLYGVECGCKIQAHVYAGMGKKKKELKILMQGRGTFPDSWEIRQLLGICYADIGEHDKAIEHYDDGLNIAYGSVIQLYCNRAIDLLQLGKLDEALNDVQYVVSLLDSNIVNTIPLIALRGGKHYEILSSADTQLSQQKCAYYDIVSVVEASYSLLIFIYNQLGNYDKAKEVFEKFINKYDINEFIQTTDVYNQYSPGLSALYFAFSITLWKSEGADKALELIKKAILFDKWNKNAQSLIREIRNNNDYNNAKYMRIYLCGKFYKPFIHEGDTVHSFMVCYFVIADDEIEALNFIKEFEPEEIRNILKVEREIKILDDMPKKPKGVYEISSYLY